MIMVSEDKIEFPDTCPQECPERQTPFYQGCTCHRCPVFCCSKDDEGICLIEPEGYNPEFAKEFKSWFDHNFDSEYFPKLFM